MKKVLIFLVVFWGATIATFSQRVVLDMEVPKLEKGAIKRVRKVFKIPKKTELYATIVVFPNDTVRFNHYELPFDFNRTLYDYLQKLKFHNTSYEVFVFDKQLTNVYVVNRIFLGRGKLEREHYLGNDEDRSLSSLLSTKKYDYVFNIHYNDLGFYKAILGFKDGLVEMSYYKDGQWHSEFVCGSDDFSFLKPLLDDKIIK